MSSTRLIPLFVCLFLATLAAAQDPPRSSGWVVIPVPEYKALRDKAFPKEPQPESAPVDATLTQADYDLHVPNGDLAEGQARFTIDVLKEGWVRVPVPGGFMVREAKLDGRPVGLTHTDAGDAALISKRGRAVLELEVGFHIASGAGDEELDVPAGKSGITRVSVSMPRRDVELKLAGGYLARRSESGGGTQWVAYARGNETLVFKWRRKIEERRNDLPLRLRGSLTELLGLGEDSTSLFAEVNVDVLQGEAREVRLQLPDKVTINQVQGATVADWEMKAGELSVTFLEPVKQTSRFTVTGEARLPHEGNIEIPLMRLLGTERETGGVAVEVLGAGEIKDLKSQGLERAEASDLGSLVAGRESPSLAAFRFRPGSATPRLLSLNVARYAQQAVLTANVEEARYRVLMTYEGKTLVEARYAVRNDQRNFVKIALPAGATVWSASRAGQPVRPGQAPDGALLLPLAKPIAGEEVPAFPIEVLYLTKGSAWEDKGKARLALPALDLPVSRTGLALYYPPVFRVAPEPGAFRKEEYAEPVSPALRGYAAAQNSSPALDRAMQQFKSSAAQSALQSLADDYKTHAKSLKAAVPLPAGVSFPAAGPSLFLVSELTGEGQGPGIDLSFQREKNGGVK